MISRACLQVGALRIAYSRASRLNSLTGQSLARTGVTNKSMADTAKTMRLRIKTASLRPTPPGFSHGRRGLSPQPQTKQRLDLMDAGRPKPTAIARFA